MFFSGDPSARRRVDLGGRSSKERDRKVLLEQTREERRRRQGLRLQNTSATKIQKFFRGKKALELARSEVRKNFCSTFGEHCERIEWNNFGTNSDFLRQLLFFFNANEDNDIAILCQICNLLLQYVKQGGDVVTLFTGVNGSSLQPLVAHRVKKITLICVQAVYQKRHDWGSQLLTTPGSTSVPSVSLLETQKVRNSGHFDGTSVLEQVLMLVASHVGHHPCCCLKVDPRWSFSSQLLSIPSLWHRLPHLKKVFSVNGFSKYYIHQIACFLPSLADVLPNDISANHPGYACVLANVLEAATWILSDAKFASDSVVAFKSMRSDKRLTSLLFLPRCWIPCQQSQHLLKINSKSLIQVFLIYTGADDDDETPMDVDIKINLDVDLERQITAAIDPKLLQHLVNALFRGTLSINDSDLSEPSDPEVDAVGCICAFLHVTFNTFPLERIMTVLAYRTEIVPALWNFIKRCHANRRWPFFSKFASSLPADAPGWLLPMSVFCPIYKHMLKIIDNGEFYEQEKPLSLKDLKSLVLILKQALWQLLWIIPSSSTQKVSSNPSGLKKLSVENVKIRARVGLSELLTQETADHLLYPNPGSGLVHELHLQYFNFLGSLLGKAMYEGILVDLPFATFFLSKVKQKYNFLNDLPSLDPELYRHLLFLKHYNGDISELELYFVIVNNEYGEQCEEELLPGGRDMRVTNDNVITFIHLVANHRLNYQIRAQSTHFLRGFQQLIPKDWIDMFNEHEIQVLISGSLESLDIDDLRSNTNYSAGYHPDHELVEMFWEVLKSLSSDNQKKFLKLVCDWMFSWPPPWISVSRTEILHSESWCSRSGGACRPLADISYLHEPSEAPPPIKGSKEQMQTKLLYAINSEAGFDLS
ncbi:E3 ubiquitin-protein ligase UPL6 [Zea mays]|uniref:HECT-type E3 ubiquitin transferase n=2 Tax=Zea mays TaxID=4577 RepID=A0A3L6D869_MAIZE|nr:hypothetical protein Zm00014a_012668 [Zea mays]PWZ04754.1 E3 ubiquitin-protein ligase UPL6 [Zea mays]